MFQVKPLQKLDFSFAIQLTDNMDWNMTVDDFSFSTKLEPEGCFVLRKNSRKIGLITSISYGNIGWFGNLIVEKAHQNKGAGKVLVEYTVNFLQARGAKAIGLYAYEHLIDYYKGFGFRVDSQFMVLKHDKLSYRAEEFGQKVTILELPAIIKLDKQCFGADRKKLLARILFDGNNQFYCLRVDGEIVGFVAAKVNEGIAEVGPLVFQPNHTDEACMLLKTVLGKLDGLRVFLYLPKASALNEALTDLGFKEAFSMSRMFLGSHYPTDFIYMAESLERG